MSNEDNSLSTPEATDNMNKSLSTSEATDNMNYRIRNATASHCKLLIANKNFIESILRYFLGKLLNA